MNLDEIWLAPLLVNKPRTGGRLLPNYSLALVSYELSLNPVQVQLCSLSYGIVSPGHTAALSRRHRAERKKDYPPSGLLALTVKCGH